MGYEKLEEHYKHRLNKTGVDFSFKNAILSHEKQRKRLEAIENEKVVDELAEFKRQTLTAPKKRRTTS